MKIKTECIGYCEVINNDRYTLGSVRSFEGSPETRKHFIDKEQLSSQNGDSTNVAVTIL